MTSVNGIWVISEIRRNSIHSSTFELLGKARDLAYKSQHSVAAVTLSDNEIPQNDLTRLFRAGADVVISLIGNLLSHYDFIPYIKALELAVKDYSPDIVLAAATTTGRSFMPGLAAKLETGLTADCTGLDIEAETGGLIQTRPAIGGNILATIRTPYHRPQLATVRPRTFEPLSHEHAEDGRVIVKRFPRGALSSPAVLLSVEQLGSSEEGISDAEVIVAGGMGLKRRDNLEKVKRLAEILKGTVGGSRKLVDLKWIEHNCQVGLSGYTVKPRLYIAAGISGAVQHIAGMQTSEFIVAINKDRHAPIFDFADIGLVGDASELIEAICDALQSRGGGSDS